MSKKKHEQLEERRIHSTIVRIYAYLTSIAIFLFCIAVFKCLELSLFKSIALVITGVVVFDIFSTVLEWIIPKIGEKFLCFKLNWLEKKKDMSKKVMSQEDIDFYFFVLFFLCLVLLMPFFV